MDQYNKRAQQSISLWIILLALLMFSTQASAARSSAPTEVLSDVSVIKYHGKSAVKVDFAFPIRYVSHDLINRGTEININLSINSREVADISQLPLLQTLIPRNPGDVPIEEVTYVTESNEPKLNVRFRKPVDVQITQGKRVTSILIILSKPFAIGPKGGKSSAKPSFFGGFVPEPAKEGKAMAPEKLEKLFNLGKTYIRQGEAKKAIELFSSLLTLPENDKTKESLELLGLARERNGQDAHARTIYEEYLKRYPKDKSTDRIKQRLADLSEDRMQPKQPLKKNKETRKSKLVGTSFFYGSVAQYWDNLTRVGDNETETVVNALDTQISMFHRDKSPNHDWRNTFVMREYYDEFDGSKGIEIGSLYTKYKDNVQNFSFTAGRHSANNIAGVLGKFDGISAGAQATEKLRMNLALGSPVSTADKQHIQTYRKFKVFNMELSEIVKGWDISPYVATEKTNEVVSRSAYGTDLRYYFDGGDLYILAEYDKVYSDWVTRILQSKYELNKKNTINFSYEEQKNVDLENALFAFDAADQIQDIVDRGLWTAEDLAKLVKGLSANTKQTTLSLKHSFSKTFSLTAKWNHAIRDYVNLDLQGVTLNQIAPEDFDKFRSVAPDIASDDYSLRLVTSASFHPRDSTIILYAYTRSDGHTGDPQVEAYTADRILFNYRRPFGNKLRTNSSLLLRDRKEVNTVRKLVKITPKETITYAKTRKFKWYMEVSIDFEDNTAPGVGGEPTTAHNQDYSIYAGYIWDF